MKNFALIIMFTLCALHTRAQEQQQAISLRTVANIELKDIRGEKQKIPHFGKRNIVIFYVDPDRSHLNKDFVDEVEGAKDLDDNLEGMGILNLGDAPFVPMRLARSIAAKRTEKSGSRVLLDEDNSLSTAWELGDCDNDFVMLIINKKGEIIFERKGILSEEDKYSARKTMDFLRQN